MPTPTDSFKKFNYALRPSKQVERKVIVEILLGLSKAGYNIREYAYVGFGSVYYVDFVMFHKYLFIDRMICIEWGEIEKRMRFNKPYKFIKLRMMPLSQYIPSISKNEELLAWLDYDRSLDPDMLRDLDGMCARLSPSSILMVTLDARPRLPRDLFDPEVMKPRQREQLIARVYQEWFGQYLGSKIEKDTGARPSAAALFYEVVAERVRQTLSPRGLRFIQFFNFFYRDGAPMLTIGGMIGSERDQDRLESAKALDHRFVRRGSEPLAITLPPLTLREKHWLDSRLFGEIKTKKLAFELDKDLLENYCEFYKEYPTYTEALL
jgi:hypothetical protein